MDYLRTTIDLHRNMVEKLDLEKIETIAGRISEAYRARRKLIIFGNGGSAADAAHFAAELEGQLSPIDKGRPPLRALVPCNLSAITAVSNDFGFEDSFSRFVGANVDEGDIVIGISTSGNSPNVLRALEKAKILRAFTIGLTGGSGGRVRKVVDICFCVPASNVSLIQEGHLMAYHRICALVVRDLFGYETFG